MAVLYIKLTENLTAKLSCSMNSVILEFANQIHEDEHGTNHMGTEILLMKGFCTF
jgi:hypothetical protein